MQQKYCDHGRSQALLTMTRPIFFARSDTQWRAAQHEVDEARSYGVDALELWGADRVHARDARGAVYDPARAAAQARIDQTSTVGTAAPCAQRAVRASPPKEKKCGATSPRS